MRKVSSQQKSNLHIDLHPLEYLGGSCSSSRSFSPSQHHPCCSISQALKTTSSYEKFQLFSFTCAVCITIQPSWASPPCWFPRSWNISFHFSTTQDIGYILLAFGLKWLGAVQRGGALNMQVLPHNTKPHREKKRLNPRRFFKLVFLLELST